MQLLHVVKPLKLSLVFIEAPEEHKLVAGEKVLWQCSKVRGQTGRCTSVARSSCGHIAVKGEPWKFQAEFEVACNFLLSVAWLRFAVLAVLSLATNVGGVAWRCIVVGVRCSLAVSVQPWRPSPAATSSRHSPGVSFLIRVCDTILIVVLLS